MPSTSKILSRQEYTEKLEMFDENRDEIQELINKDPEFARKTKQFFEIDPNTYQFRDDRKVDDVDSAINLQSQAISKPVESKVKPTEPGEIEQEEEGFFKKLYNKFTNLEELGKTADAVINIPFERVPKQVIEDVQLTSMSLLESAGLADISDVLDLEEEIQEERDQDFSKSPHPESSRISSSIQSGIVEFAGPQKYGAFAGKLAGLGPRASQLVGDAFGGAVAGGLSAPLGEKTQGAFQGAILSYGLGRLTRPKQGAGNELSQAASDHKVRMSKGQLSGKNWVQSVEESLSAAPVVGTTRFYRNQYKDLTNASNELLNKLASQAGQNKDSIFAISSSTKLAPLYQGMAKTAVKELKRARNINRGQFTSISKELNKMGLVSPGSTVKTANKILDGTTDAVTEFLGKESTKLVKEYANIGTVKFSDLHIKRQMLDQLISTADASGNKAVVKNLSKLRTAITQDLRNTAQKGGKLKQFDDANQFYKDNILPFSDIVFDPTSFEEKAYKMVKSAMTPGKGIESTVPKKFIRLLDKRGKNTAGYAMVRNAFEKSVDKQGNIDFKKFAQLTKQSSGELDIAINKGHREALDGLEKIIGALDKKTLNIGAGSSGSLGLRDARTAALVTGGAGAAMSPVAAGSALAAIAVISKMLTNQNGIRILRSAKKLNEDQVIGLARKIIQGVASSDLSKDVKSIEEENKLLEDDIPNEKQF